MKPGKSSPAEPKPSKDEFLAFARKNGFADYIAAQCFRHYNRPTRNWRFEDGKGAPVLREHWLRILERFEREEEQRNR